MDAENVNTVSNLTVKLHRRVAIRCPLNGSPLPNITWYKVSNYINLLLKINGKVGIAKEFKIKLLFISV